MITHCSHNLFPQKNSFVFFAGEKPKGAAERAETKEAAKETPEAKAQAALKRAETYITANKKKLGIDNIQFGTDKETGGVKVTITDAPGKTKFSKLPKSVQKYFRDVATSYVLLKKAVIEKQAGKGLEEHSDRLQTATNLFNLDQLQDAGIDVGLEEHKG